MNRLAFVIVALCVFGCVATGELFKEAPPPPEGKALIYIYRGSGIAFSVPSAVFYVDGVKTAELNIGGYTWLYVPVGSHTLRQEWAFGEGSDQTLEISANWEAGKVYYYSFNTDWGHAFPYKVVHWALLPVEPEQARPEIAKYHYQPAINAASSASTK